jgi:hypothetical protein
MAEASCSRHRGRRLAVIAGHSGTNQVGGAGSACRIDGHMKLYRLLGGDLTGTWK